MDSNSKEISSIEYTLEDAFDIIKSSLGESHQIINTLFLSQKQKYEDIINSMDKKMNFFNSHIEKLEKENSQLKNTINQLQNKLLALSHRLKQLSKEDENENKKIDKKYLNLKKNNLIRNNNKIREMQTNTTRELNGTNLTDIKNLDKNENNFIDNELFNLNKQTIDVNKIKKSINLHLFNKKFKSKKEKTYSQGFNFSNFITTPTRILQKENNVYIKENESQSSNSLENNYNIQKSKTINTMNQRRKTFNNLTFKNSINRLENNQKDKFNKISKRIKHLKNGLSINNLENNYNDNKIRYNNTTYSLKRRNYSNYKDLNIFDN